MEEQSNTLSSMSLGIPIAEVLKMPDSKTAIYRILVAIAGEPKVYLKKNSTTDEYLDIPIGDAVSLMDMRAWDAVEPCKKNFTPGSIWSLNVTKGSWDGKPQLTFQPGDSRLVASSMAELLSKEGGTLLASNLRRAYEPIPDFIRDMTRVMMNIDTNACLDLKIHPLDPTPAEIARRIFGFKFGWHAVYENLNTFMIENRGASELDFLESDDFRVLFENDAASDFFKAYFYAPAAKGHHGNFLHGLIVHVDGMKGIVDALEAISRKSPSVKLFKDGNGNPIPFESNGPKLDFDLLKAMCYIHDTYKLDEYVWTDIGGISYRDPAHPFYHDVRIAFRLQALKSEFGIPERENSIFDKMTAIALTHHGQWGEYVPDKRRMTYPECTIFHFIDNLEAKTTEALERT